MRAAYNEFHFHEVIETHFSLEGKPSAVAEPSRCFQAAKTEANGVGGMNYLKTLEAEVSAWPNVGVHPHRFVGREFRFAPAEVGHAHRGGIVDIPFPRSIRDARLDQGLAEGAPLGSRFRLDYLSGPQRGRAKACSLAKWDCPISGYALKISTDPQRLLAQETERLHLSPQFRSLLGAFVPKTANQAATEPLSA